ncbi:PhnD/SsuA/transferrin family substrate-binding protein [Halorhodospira halochloris]|uniref:phosphate/phosphite/phosphonate ABC transporter substrate-binding protein n=1 Tax=Halorhodospira halochloris TaxID=1052 RepID=UPI001EE908E8|nr:PhnD/SsuA/transferrin family substrate-binding protein [Halorhodospira halochloris]MCG5530050.1 PhnD/SsuA/transferrin family substrate-binding protein [Halorhodospira halochloris]
MKRLPHLIATLALTAGATGNAFAELSDVCPANIRLADTGIEGMEELSRAFGPFADSFSEKTGLDIEFFSVSDRTAAATALRYDEVDMILAGPSEYAVIKSRQDVDIVFGIERDHYGTYFVVPADSDAQQLSDIADKRVALKDAGSTTGHIVPTWMMVQAGIDPDRDVNVVMAGDARIRALANGDVEVLGGGYRDVSVLERVAPDFDYRITGDSGTMPRDPFIARSSLGSECISGLREVVERNGEEMFSSFVASAQEGGTDEAQNRAKYFDGRFVFDITDSEYDLIREAYKMVGMSLD